MGTLKDNAATSSEHQRFRDAHDNLALTTNSFFKGFDKAIANHYTRAYMNCRGMRAILDRAGIHGG